MLFNWFRIFRRNGATVTDLSLDNQDDSTDTLADLSSSEYLYIAQNYPFNNFFCWFDVANTNSTNIFFEGLIILFFHGVHNTNCLYFHKNFLVFYQVCVFCLKCIYSKYNFLICTWHLLNFIKASPNVFVLISHFSNVFAFFHNYFLLKIISLNIVKLVADMHLEWLNTKLKIKK